MITTIADLRSYADNFLNFFDREKINSYQDLFDRIGKKYVIDEKNHSYFNLELRPSILNTRALTISHIIPNLQGIPLEIKLNKELNYSTIILKAQEIVAGYESFYQRDGNIIQAKKLEGISIDENRSELNLLRVISSTMN